VTSSAAGKIGSMPPSPACLPRRAGEAPAVAVLAPSNDGLDLYPNEHAEWLSLRCHKRSDIGQDEGAQAGTGADDPHPS
jgi:hypothetical protein